MINLDLFQKYLKEYKEDFIPRFKFESNYIWQAVQNFQVNFNLEAEDFHNMLNLALSKTGKLMVLRSLIYADQPRKQILLLAETYPKETAKMFADLFDEQIPLVDRLLSARRTTTSLRTSWNDREDCPFKFIHNHQNFYIISLYLFLRYPDKYFIYQASMFREASLFLQTSYQFDSAKPENNVINSQLFMQELQKNLQQDAELVKLLRSCLRDKHYPDKELNILTSDFVYFLKVRSSTQKRLIYKPRFKKNQSSKKYGQKNTQGTNNH